MHWPNFFFLIYFFQIHWMNCCLSPGVEPVWSIIVLYCHRGRIGGCFSKGYLGAFGNRKIGKWMLVRWPKQSTWVKTNCLNPGGTCNRGPLFVLHLLCSSTVLSTFIWMHLIFTATLWGGYYRDPHVSDEKTKVEKLLDVTLLLSSRAAWMQSMYLSSLFFVPPHSLLCPI